VPLKPDPTFYPSPASAAEGPPEELAYVVTLNTSSNGDAKPDALAVVDVNPESSTYGKAIGRLDMPNVGDELHHFGWNACSSALCPWAPHPHVERRYFLIPGLRSSRIHVVDVKDDPVNPTLTKVIEPEELHHRTGYSRPHTVHCGPDGLYVSALGNPEGDGPGGVLLLDHDDFSPRGRWEIDRGPQNLAYDVWWNIGYDTLLTSEWGTPNMVEGGLQPELLLSNQYGHHLHVWDLRKRRHKQAIDLGPEHRWSSSCGRLTTRRARTASSASSSRPPTSAPRCGCGAVRTTAPSPSRRSSRSRPSRPTPTSSPTRSSRSAPCRRS
jgi:methanethiol oxidase